MSSSPSSSKSSTPRRDGNFLTKSRQDENLCATIDVPKIDRSQIDDLNSTKLGEGTYGHVMKCRFRQTPESLWENIAIKYGTDPSHTENLIREAKVILTHIRHPNCIRIFGFYECPKNGMGVAMELMDCNLAYLLTKRTIEYKIDHAVSWLYQLSDAVNYFHTRNHIHRDLKLQNLLLCNRYHTLKVCDFGTFTTLHESMTLNRGTPMTMAPEIIRGTKNYTTNESPYLASHPHDAYVIYWNIVTKNLRPPKVLCDEVLSRFYERCCEEVNDVNTSLYFLLRVGNNSAEMRNGKLEFLEVVLCDRICWHDDPDKRPDSQQLLRYFSILRREYPNSDDPLIDANTNEPAVTPQPKPSNSSFPKHRRGRSDQSTLIKLNGVADTRVAQLVNEDDGPPNMRNSRSHSEITRRKESEDERLRPLSQATEMPANVLDYIDHSLRPADPVIGDEASEQIYNEHIAACHELYDHDLSLQRALADKHNAIVNLAHMEEYRKLAERKRQLEQLRDDALKRIQQHS